MKTKRYIAVILSLVVLGGCGSTIEPAGPEPSVTAPPSTVAPQPTDPPHPPTSAPAVDPGPVATVPLPALEDGPAGMGCNPGGDSLNDGQWFGFVSGGDDTSLELDLACWFSGTAAEEAAAEDGEESPPPNDYYVRNQNPQLRSLPIAADAQVLWYPTGDPHSGTIVSYADWLTERSGGYPLGVWVTIIDGSVTSVTEQWVP